MRRFGGRDRGTVFERLAAIKQTATEDKCIKEFEMLVAQTKGVTEDQLLEYFFAGLQDKVRNQIRPHNPKDLLTSMDVARDEEEVYRNVRTAKGTMAKSNQPWGRY